MNQCKGQSDLHVHKYALINQRAENIEKYNSIFIKWYIRCYILNIIIEMKQKHMPLVNYYDTVSHVNGFSEKDFLKKKHCMSFSSAAKRLSFKPL